MHALVTRLGTDMGAGDEVEGTPDESDSWSIGGVVRTIVEMRPEEDARALLGADSRARLSRALLG